VKPIVNGIVGKVRGAYLGPQIKLHYGFMEQELKKKPWFAGPHFTAADIQMSYPLEAGLSRGTAANEYPKIQDYVKRMKERPAWTRAEAKVGDFGTPM
jgi:glutathione S-transferase